MDISPLIKGAVKAVKSNAPEILTALGVTGVVTTAYLAGKAAWDAHEDVLKVQFYNEDGTMRNPVYIMPTKERAKLTWMRYIPAAAAGAVTIGCIVAGHRTSSNRTAAAVAAYSLTEKAFDQYKEKAAEDLGKAKEQRLRDDIAQEKVTANPPSREIVVMGDGECLCFDIRSVRYFRSSHEAIKRAENDINYQINHERYVSLSEFYIAIGLPITKESVYNGWCLDRGLMELDITTTLSENNHPCLAIDYNYVQPIHDEPAE